MINRLILLGLLLSWFCGTAFANVLSWKTYTNMYDIRDMVFHNGNIWCATNGGIFKYDTIDSTFQSFTNIDGLSDINVRSIEIDSDGDIWIGTFNGYINLLHLPAMDFELIDDFQRHIIYDIAVLNQDSVLIAFDNGIGLYVKSDREVKESYYSLGTRFEARIQVNSLFIHGKEIWAATNAGIAKTNLSKINLNDPESWTNYTTLDGLPGSKVRAIQAAHNVIYAITDQGVARFDTTNWVPVNNGLTGIVDKLYSFFEKSDTLFLTCDWGVYRYDPQSNWWYHWWKHKPIDVIGYATTMCFDDSDRLWVGRQGIKESGGIAYNKYPDSTWHEIYPPGPASSRINDLAIDQHGNWWCTATDAGVFMYDGNDWNRIPLDNCRGTKDYRAITVDASNQIWAGSAGGGLTRISQDSIFTYYCSGYLSGTSEYPNYYVVEDVAVDAKNNVWIVNRFAANSNILAVVTPDSQWYYFSKILTNEVEKIEIDQHDRVWLTSNKNGLFVLDYGLSLEDPSDDNFNQGFNRSEGLWSNTVTALKEDYEGTMWIGTEEGLNYWYSIGGETRLDSFYYNIISNNIKALTVDAQNNVWVGTSAGISMLPAADRFRPVNYTSQNSPLVSDEILALTFDENTGDLFICTPAGLSVLETGLKATKSADYELFQLYPNPFYINGRANQLFITNLAENSEAVKIYTINGVLVKDIPLDDPTRGGFGGQAIWDGSNDNNEFVASGVYLVFVYTEEGKTHLSKVAVIRE